MKNINKFRIKTYGCVLLVNFIVLACAYYIMPIAMNYPPLSEEADFQAKVESISHLNQYIIVYALSSTIYVVALKILTKDIIKYLKKKDNNEKIEYGEVQNVRNQSFLIPYKFYITQIVFLLIISVTLAFAIISGAYTILKFILICFSIISLINIMQFIILQTELNKIIKRSYETEKRYCKLKTRQIKFSTGLMFQLIPFLAVAIIIMSLIGYSKTISEKGNTSALYYELKIENAEIEKIDKESLIEALNEIELKEQLDFYFIIDPYEEIYTSDATQTVSEFSMEYMNHYITGKSGMSYEFYGTEAQSYVEKFTDENGQVWKVGFRFETRDDVLLTYYIFIIIIATAIFTAILYVWSKNIAKNIVEVSDSLEHISQNASTINENVLPIYANNEIGDLSFSYNKIQELTNDYVKDIEDKQHVMERQAQFSILGEFAGGLAHDLNSPLSAVKMDIGTMKMYINSPKIQAEEQIKEKVNSMFLNVEKSLESMSATIESVRNQIRSTGDSQSDEINILNSLEGIKIMFRSIFMKNNCSLEVDIQDDVIVIGEKNKLERVIENLIKNSLDAYRANGLKGKIVVSAYEQEGFAYINVADEAGGLDESIKDKIFKEIKTTKKENGTGFGLYYSNTIIEGSFNGTMSFDTTEGHGTVFTIKIPNKGE